MMKRQTLAVIWTAIGLTAGSTTCAQQTQPAAGQSPQRVHHHEFRPMKLKPNAPQWQKYLVAAEQFHVKGDDARAKQYYFEALSQLEKAPRTSKTLNFPISRLEHEIMKMYPKYPNDKPVNEPATQVKVDEEQIAVFTRINRLNQYYPSPDNLMAKIVGTQIDLAKADLKKNQDELSKTKDAAGAGASGKDDKGKEASETQPAQQ